MKTKEFLKRTSFFILALFLCVVILGGVCSFSDGSIEFTVNLDYWRRDSIRIRIYKDNGSVYQEYDSIIVNSPTSYYTFYLPRGNYYFYALEYNNAEYYCTVDFPSNWGTGYSNRKTFDSDFYVNIRVNPTATSARQYYFVVDLRNIYIYSLCHFEAWGKIQYFPRHLPK